MMAKVPAKMVADINQLSKPLQLTPSHLQSYNGYVYYCATHPNSGAELWRSDGTEGGTEMVADLAPGPESSNPSYLVTANNYLFFSTRIGSTHGLWKSDGTAQGTVLLKTIGDYSRSMILVVFKNEVYFSLGDLPRFFLWKTDGTDEGTVPVKEFSDSFNELDGGFKVVDNFAYFKVRGTYWRSDGTETGTTTLSDNFPALYKPIIYDIASASGKLLLTTNSNHGGEDLWQVSNDGSEAVKIRNFNSSPKFFSTNDKTYIVAGYGGKELWKTDGTIGGTALVTVLDSTPDYFLTYQQLTYFSVGRGRELWTTDETAAGTRLIKSFITNDGNFTERPIESGGYLYFPVRGGSKGKELYRTNGTAAGTVLLGSFNAPQYSGVSLFLTSHNNTVFFTAATDEVGSQLWNTNGTLEGTKTVKLSKAGNSSDPGLGFYYKNNWIFAAHNGVEGNELWITDGTPIGTKLIRDINIGSEGSFPHGFTLYKKKVYFVAKNGSSNWQLWVTDGTWKGTRVVNNGSIDTYYSDSRRNGQSPIVATSKGLFFSSASYKNSALWISNGKPKGTQVVKNIPLNQPFSSIGELTKVGDRVYFAAGMGLWQSDGTNAGTVMLSEHCIPKYITNVNGIVFFSGYHPLFNRKLWKSDDNGTTVVINSSADGQGFEPRNLVAVHDKVYYTDETSEHGGELWISDGTVGGTHIVKDINVTPQAYQPSSTLSSGVHNITNLNGKVVFSADDGVHGFELWCSDGTEAGTYLIEDINPFGDGVPALSWLPSDKPSIQTIASSGSTAYFQAGDTIHGRELWRTDGTASGTIMISDLAINNSGLPQGFSQGANKLLFSADDGLHGRELWLLDLVPESSIRYWELY